MQVTRIPTETRLDRRGLNFYKYINTTVHRPPLPVYPGLLYLFTQAWSTCLPRPPLPVYPGLVYLFTQAWSTCLPRPGQKGCATSEIIIFKILAAGPLSTWAPGPAASILKMMISKKKDRGRRPPHGRESKQGSTCLHRPGPLVYIGLDTNWTLMNTK